MVTSIKTAFIAAALYGVCLAAPARVQADPLVFTLTNPTPSAAAGTSINFAATVANPNAQPFTIQYRGVSSAGPFDLVGVIETFVFPLPEPYLPYNVPGLTEVSGNVFGIVLRSNLAPGTYFGNIFIHGHFLDGTEAEYSVPASVTIVSEVPEPTSMFLLGTGLMGLAGAVRRGTRRVKSESA